MRGIVADGVHAARRGDLHDLCAELGIRHTQELIPADHTPRSWLGQLTYEGIADRWPAGATEESLALIEHELQPIGELQHEPYFLTVQDLVRQLRSVFRARRHGRRFFATADSV
jgi:DNA polymerase III alpha subunit